MGPFEMIVAIVLIAVVGGIVRSKAKLKHGTPEKLEEYLDQTGVTGQLRKIDQLEKRVRVLERIVTDKKMNLADEIENL